MGRGRIDVLDPASSGRRPASTRGCRGSCRTTRVLCRGSPGAQHRSLGVVDPAEVALPQPVGVADDVGRAVPPVVALHDRGLVGRRPARARPRPRRRRGAGDGHRVAAPGPRRSGAAVASSTEKTSMAGPKSASPNVRLAGHALGAGHARSTTRLIDGRLGQRRVEVVADDDVADARAGPASRPGWASRRRRPGTPRASTAPGSSPAAPAAPGTGSPTGCRETADIGSSMVQPQVCTPKPEPGMIQARRRPGPALQVVGGLVPVVGHLGPAGRAQVERDRRLGHEQRRGTSARRRRPAADLRARAGGRATRGPASPRAPGRTPHRSRRTAGAARSGRSWRRCGSRSQSRRACPARVGERRAQRGGVPDDQARHAEEQRTARAGCARAERNVTSPSTPTAASSPLARTIHGLEGELEAGRPRRGSRRWSCS